MMKSFLARSARWAGSVLASSVLSASLLADTAPDRSFPSARDSDPRVLGWMQGQPPPPDRVIRGYDPDFFSFPKIRWSVCHMRELRPTVRVSRGLGAPSMLPRAEDPAIEALRVQPSNGGDALSWTAALDATYTDGIVILHRGEIVHERYAGCLDEGGQHAAMSMTKSLIGLLTEILVQEGVLDDTVEVAEIVPELADSAFGNATVRQVMDMTTSLDYSENYADPEASVWVYAASGNPFPRGVDDTSPDGYWAFLPTVQASGPHGRAFGYKTVNTDALAWILSRTTGQSVAELLSERLWSRMGAEQSAYFQVDARGTPFAGGGLSAGLRDMARIGLLMLQGGEIDGERLFPASVVESIRGGGNREKFQLGYSGLPGGSYRSMWWVFHNGNGAFAARGVHGQTVYVDPAADMVIARFASHPVAGNAANDPISLPAYQAVADYLTGRSEAP
ncbi:serine hydrolase domain-containing protein [Wenzhouxiangella marina]|uniref:6-aminohexanoate hydrolase n=1 Tax=Wenzhouxiangella marina TaxID=1579979 RepID=A0A0K0XV16_9GAMM|nr:serine hydrolase [Wenzhouxiangella marina]AKS41467.1 6-aminohexanoate hydrolase [Wenzhouxiangella marina]MBB6086776.1 hypothetical protein [Wenzhouxiangella marina]